LRLRKLELFIW
jgi:hypothetical protein